MALISPIKLNIAKKLKEDKVYRKRFFRGQAQDEIAMELRSLREKRKMRQTDLAKESGMKQSAISRIEQAEYCGWSFTTLLRVANALDARLRVTLEPAEKVIARYEAQEASVALGAAQSGEVLASYPIAQGSAQLSGVTAIAADFVTGIGIFTMASGSYKLMQHERTIPHIGGPSYGDETTGKEHTAKSDPFYSNQVARS